MTYTALKTIIHSGNYNPDELLTKLDIFLLGNRITTEQYNELSNIITEQFAKTDS